jgi:hypothetical protein
VIIQGAVTFKPAEEVLVVRRFDLAIDCAHPAALARFWAEALGYPEPEVGADPDEDVVLEPPSDNLPLVYFQRVPEGKVAKNRLHLDLKVGGEAPREAQRARIDAEAARLVALGASDRRGPIEEGGSYWVRMSDPEGNEFCLIRS